MNFQTRLAANTLNLGGVISNPTDTIQGLTCLPKHTHAMQKMGRLKRRNPQKGLILLASEVHFFQPFVQDMDLLVQITPQKQPTTYLLKTHKNVSALITGNFDTVAVRLTDNRLIASLCERCNSALLSTSANITGRSAATSIFELNVAFKQELDFIIAPQGYNTQASQIINLQTGERLR
ncbi:TsaC protein (YrdC domain) required for threonylcarbamoyladenosine t(6)A37 modification in tRNA [Bathymodiolus heckerae thiotrophic gill symbiont]|uniref:L-threonylcarbamoyladenylate synthase n=1 Tax=Bathymodiolus heckerae thiotrophic gill symbiont TaxID=1052212 RepID=UPI0010AF3E73|nr:Sua5/YciO/YrdC/YwlC family protein [Bathymodiolus heckerae thiotrophic gill symbiont]SMN14115.1 TsaC protein (YrdC domain) required for threonylcarbamoyladenosine t(6)A37 modification in tRNA [Bathymodiolus heckerae thiotrophic gill symbiont]SMN16039.1 TsaC protein (YrdC domain) required for threonylcarbamoyladenosine t(6)A37 modification in tRNA [uncultured Candidatus Thioglobus sp.]